VDEATHTRFLITLRRSETNAERKRPTSSLLPCVHSNAARVWLHS